MPERRKGASVKKKTSLAIDRGKLQRARQILGTDTLAATVDAAFDEVIRRDAQRRLMERIRNSPTGGLGPTPEELGRLREPR